MKPRVAVLAAALVISFALPVNADDHRAPRATLRVAGQVQEGLNYHADGWSQPAEPGFCTITFTSGYPIFPKARKHSPGQEIVVRLHKEAPPVEVEVRRWPRVNHKGHAAGTPSSLPWLLRPRTSPGGIRSWEIVVLLPVFEGHLYLGVDAYWRDEDGCSQEPDLGNQFSAWTFHLRPR